MREVMIVTRRELKSYFASPIAYVFGVLFLVVMGVLTIMTGQMLEHGQPASLQTFFLRLPLIFLFFVPALTMRLWAEERKLGTLELLMTFPVPISKLILGKFLAAVAYLGLIMLLTIGLPLTVSAYGDLDWGPVIAGYIAALLMASAYLAIGMFCSALTRDQIIALLVALVTLLVLYFLGDPSVLLVMGNLLPEWFVGLLGGISPNGYFISVARGVIDTRDLIFYACFCGFFLYMNAVVLQGRRLKG